MVLERCEQEGLRSQWTDDGLREDVDEVGSALAEGWAKGGEQDGSWVGHPEGPAHFYMFAGCDGQAD